MKKYFVLCFLFIILVGLSVSAQALKNQNSVEVKSADSGVKNVNEDVNSNDDKSPLPDNDDSSGSGYTDAGDTDTSGSLDDDYSDMSRPKKIKDGEYRTINEKTFRIKTRADDKLSIVSDDVEAETNLEIQEESSDGQSTKLKVKLSNGKNADIKIMPITASENALERLKLKVCSEKNNCKIELKEVGDKNKQLAYEIQLERHSRILGIFAKKMTVKAEISAENGEVIRVKKPWWAFLAIEPSESD